MASSEDRESLKQILKTHSVRFGDFVLASGQRSNVYVDCRLTTLRAEAMPLIGRLMLEKMREHGWAEDAWPDIYPRVLAADILVIAGPIWLGDNSSVTKQVIERLYALSGLLNDKGQYLFYGRVGGCLITGNEDGIKHCAMNILYSLQHLGYTIPPNADAGWIGEAGPGPSYLDPGSGGPENDFTNRNTTFMTWNLMHLAQMLKERGGIPAYGNARSEWDAGARFDFENPEYR